ncbi:hypothetical protein F2Q69_00033930 [Brassica cretica]|uniref:Pectinesterase inhibitor domain-containing protein n=1 Tax=Brassica cretica TaxID=69181 RepID=A0A8S9SV58_BRACR|nr:hypothetical protein F2Q69_00033930 [Brassica cretica]
MAKFSVLSTFAAAAITLQLLLVPASASPQMKYIDAICDRSHDQDYCNPLAEAVMALTIAHAEKTAAFVAETGKTDPTFTEYHKAYLTVVADLKSANVKLKESPDTAHYDVRSSTDQMKRVEGLVASKNDQASTTLKEMTVQMEKLLDLAASAADAVDDDDENIHRRV